MDDKDNNENAEIDLKDYLKLIFAKKWLVLGALLFAVALAVIYNFSAPKTYEVSSWLEIGKMKENRLIEDPIQIIQKMKMGVYEKDSSGIAILNPDQTDLVQFKIKSVEPEKTKKYLEKVIALILADHEQKIAVKKEAIQNKIQRIQENEIKRIQENEIKRIQEKIVLLGQEKKILEAKIETPISQFDLFFIKDRLLGKNQDIESSYSNIEDLHSKIEESYSKIDSLKESIEEIQPTKIVKDIVILDTFIKQKFLINIAMAGLLGLFLGIFIVFSEK